MLYWHWIKRGFDFRYYVLEDVLEAAERRQWEDERSAT